RASWDQATAHVAEGLQRILDRYGPQAIAFSLSGQLLTEDYYVANKLAKGFLGTANADTNSRLCMASTVAGHRRAFGGDVVPGCYDDLDVADLIVLVGSNTAWCHPVIYRRIVDSRERHGARIVVIDPRRTVTGADADLLLPIAPGTDTALFCGLLVHLAERGALDHAYIEAHTSGLAETLARAKEIAPTPRAAAAATGLAERDVVRFFDLFLETRRTVTCFSQGVNQSAQGTDKVNAIINCHLATGRIGRPGMGPLSLTGQPNAMGGREVGGLANQLGAHMAFTPGNVDRVRRFWNAPRIAEHEGLKAVQMFEAIERGEIKALWVMATNPAVSLPRASAMSDALKKLDLFVVSENVAHNDTLAAAPHVLLPAAAWGEKDGAVTNSERRISRQRAFLPRPGETQPDWRIVCDVATRLGFGESFAFRSAADVFREHADLSGFENDGARGFDIGALAAITDAQYDVLEPVQWPLRKVGEPPVTRLFGDGDFFTEDRKARFVPPALPALREQTSAAFPLRLNTGRVRDQWHTMTRTGESPTLGAHRPEPFVEVHPRDAEQHGLTPGGFARVRTTHGSCVFRVIVSEDQQRGLLFAPIHWSDANASSARVGDLVAPFTDPFSGQPESKATPATIEPVRFASRGLLLSRGPVVLPDGTWWARVATTSATILTFATNDTAAAWRTRAPDYFPGAVLTEYADPGAGIYRAAAFIGGKPCGALFVGPSDAPPQWSDLCEMTAHSGIAASGPVVCACFSVPAADAAASRRAGTRCGSCLPELRQLAAYLQMETNHEAAHAG
ncbi:MAG: molybdopterin-dependent oxidoreductase, partial [Xanthobacteraceae bacterium]